MVIMWNIWQYKNQLHNPNKNQSESQLINLIERSISEHKGRKKHIPLNLSGLRCESHLSHANWIPLSTNVWEMNVDASWNESSNQGEMGLIVRDSGGSLICARMQKISKKSNRCPGS